MREAEQETNDRIALAALGCYEAKPGSTPKLVTVSENATYLIEGRSAKMVLRVHRPGYHRRNQIESELQWSQALLHSGTVDTAAVIPSRNGNLVEKVRIDGGLQWRYCVMFEFLEGVEPNEHEIVQEFERLGTIAAKMHQFTKGWIPPPQFDRMVWNFETILGGTPHWGRWQDGNGIDGPGIQLLSRTGTVIDQQLRAYGFGTERFGLIHADMRLANLLVDESTTNVIDFDDCGFGWYMYDLAAALSFIENRTDVNDAIAQWIAGYQQVMPLTKADIAILPTMIMMRRMLLVAWLGSHPMAELAQDLGLPFTQVTYTLAERYLNQHA